MLASAIALVFMGLETTTLATKGLTSLTNAQVLLVTSTARLSVGRRCWAANPRIESGSTRNDPDLSDVPSWREYVKCGDLLMKIDADESRLLLVARTRGGGAFGLVPDFGLSFDRAHGDKLHEALFPGVAPLCR